MGLSRNRPKDKLVGISACLCVAHLLDRNPVFVSFCFCGLLAASWCADLGIVGKEKSDG